MNKKFIFQFFFHLLVIICFIVFEINAIFLVGSKAKWYDFVIFYLIDIVYFYTSSYWLFYKIEISEFTRLIKASILVIWFLLWTLILFIVTKLLLQFHEKDMLQKEVFTHVYRIVWRRGFLLFIASGVWYARYSIKKQKQVVEKEFQLIEKERQLMEQERTIMKQELALLRAKVDPHLLLNTFTKVHATVAERCPELTTTFDLLAEVMHLSLEGSDVNYTSLLKDEIHLINTFVELNKEMVFKDTFLIVEIDIPDLIAIIPFPPKLLINAVENLFKYGLLNDQEKLAHIKLSYASGTLFFVTRNAVTYPDKLPSHNIGLENIKQRLDVHFPNNYTFNTKVTENGFFELNLELKL